MDKLPAGVEVEGVLLTHTHFDHIYGLNTLVKRFPEVRILTNEFGVKELSDPKLNMSRYHECVKHFVLTDNAKVEVVHEGDKLDILGCSIRVVETPGHDPSCICYIVNQHIFTGDEYIPGVNVITNFRCSDKEFAEMSLERILILSDGLEVCPGHEVGVG